jgi:hypothetical protein
MLRVLLSHDDKTAYFNVPHNSLEVGNYLLAVGCLKPYAEIHLNDDDDPEQVQAKLIAETAIDNHLQLLFEQNARLSVINTVCDLFYHLPIGQQIDLTHRMADGYINDYKDLLDAIKEIKVAESPHDLAAIVFSRVRLWTDGGEQCEFFMGGVPKSYDDIEDHEDVIDFKEFLEQTPDAETEGITAYITTFTEGDGETQPASQADIDRIYSVIADAEIDVITGWNMIGENSFAFDYDIGELFNLKSDSAEETEILEYSAMVEKIMPEVESGSDDPVMIWRENGGWNFEYAVGEGKSAAIRSKDPSAITVTGADFAKGSYPYVFDKILTMRLYAEYKATPLDLPHRWELNELANLLDDSMVELSSEAAEYIASLDNPLEKLHAQVAPCLHVENYDEAIQIIEKMGEATEQLGMTEME